MLNLADIKSACTLDTIVYTDHARERMRDRDIKHDDIVSAINGGEILEQYADDKPFPSCLIIGYADKTPLHVVLSLDRGILWIITTYVPTQEKWEAGYKIRKAAK